MSCCRNKHIKKRRVEKMSNGNDFCVVNDPKALMEAGKGKIVEKYVVVFSFAKEKYYHKYQTPEPTCKGGVFGFLCFNDLTSVPKCLEGRKMKTLGCIQDRPGHTLWQIQICDMGVDPYVNPFEKKGELPIVIDENNKIMSYFDPRTNRFVQPGNLVFAIHPLTEFIFSNFLMKKNGNRGNDHKKNGGLLKI